MTCHGIRPNVRHIGILHLVLILTISPQSTCHSAPVCEILSKSDHPQQKEMTSCRFSRRLISATLGFRGPVMGSLKTPCTTSYRSSIETMALNCLVFEKIAFLQFDDRQTDQQTNRWTRPSHEAALAVASGGLINDIQCDMDIQYAVLYYRNKQTNKLKQRNSYIAPFNYIVSRKRSLGCIVSHVDAKSYTTLLQVYREQKRPRPQPLTVIMWPSCRMPHYALHNNLHVCPSIPLFCTHR